MNGKKIVVMLMAGLLAFGISGCQPESPPEESSQVQSSVIAEDNGITVKSPEKPYFEKFDSFEDKAEPFDSAFAEGEDTRLTKATSALTADNVHYEFTEYGIAENMLGSEIDVVTVEVERKGKTVYTKTTKRIADDITQDEFLTVDKQSYRLTENRTKSAKENMADDVIFVTSSMDAIADGINEEGTVEVNGENLIYEFYEFGNARIIAYFRGDDFIRADLYLKGENGFAYEGYFEGNFHMEFDESLLEKP